MTDPKTLRVLLVDDDPMARSGVASLLRRDPGLEIVGEATDGDEVVAAVRRTHPDVVLMDLRMQRVGGVEAIGLLQREVAPPRVVALTAFNEDHYVIDALDAGAVGFLLKGAAPEDFRRAIRLAVDGESFIDPFATRHLIAQAARPRRGSAAHRRALDSLSERETAIAKMIWEARSNPEIGQALYLAETTVKTHVSHVMAKLDCTSRVQVALLVERAGGL